MTLNSVSSSEPSYEQPANQSLGTNEFEAQIVEGAQGTVKLAAIVPAVTMPNGQIVACKDTQTGQYVDCPNGVGQAGNGGSLGQPIMPNQRPVAPLQLMPNGQPRGGGGGRGVPAMPDLPLGGGGGIPYNPIPAGEGNPLRGGYEIRPTVPTGSGQRINQSGFTSRLDSSHPKISAMADQVAGEFRVSSVALKAMILKEYGGEPDHDNISGSNTTNDSGYNGPMQLSRTVVKECTPDFIAKYNRRPDSTAPLDNIRLGVIYAHHTTEGINRRNVTVAELYGRHNQGARGYETLRAHANERAVDVFRRNDISTSNITGNLPPGYQHLGSDITAGQFIQGWRENIINASGGDYRFWE
jgi:hypothetical protein